MNRVLSLPTGISPGGHRLKLRRKPVDFFSSFSPPSRSGFDFVTIYFFLSFFLTSVAFCLRGDRLLLRRLRLSSVLFLYYTFL